MSLISQRRNWGRAEFTDMPKVPTVTALNERFKFYFFLNLLCCPWPHPLWQMHANQKVKQTSKRQPFLSPASGKLQPWCFWSVTWKEVSGRVPLIFIPPLHSSLYRGKEECDQASTTSYLLPYWVGLFTARKPIIPQASASIQVLEWGLKVPQAEPTVLWSFTVWNSAIVSHRSHAGMRSITLGTR